MTPAPDTLAALEAQLERAEEAKLACELSDDHAYVSGRIELYERRVRELRARIAAMRKEGGE